MKKIFLILALLAMAPTGAFAQSSLARAFTTSGEALTSASTIDLTAGNDISVSFWLNITSDPGVQVFLETGSPDVGTFSFFTQGDGKIYFVCTGDTSYHASAIAYPATNDWHHYLFVFKDGCVFDADTYAFVDGSLATETFHDASGDVSTFANRTLHVGERNGGSFPANVAIADIAIYEAVLTGTEATALYGCGDPEAYSPSFYWAFTGASPEAATVGGVALNVGGGGTVASNCMGGPPPPIISFINKVFASASAPGTLSFDETDMTGADTFTISLAYYHDSSGLTCTDSEMNDYTLVVDETASDFTGTAVLVALNATSGPTMTFSCTGTSIYASGVVRGWDGVRPVGAVDQTATDTGGLTETSIQVGPVTPSVDDELILVVSGNSNDVSEMFSVDGGFTDLTHIVSSSGAYFGIADAYLIQSTAAAANPTISWTTSEQASAVIVTFRPNTGVVLGGGKPLLLRLGL